jgi:RNA recognition motif-containing protein
MPVSVIIDHLPLDFTEEALAAVFNGFGPIRSVRIVRGGINQSLAFGFVELDNEARACAAVLSLNGQEIRGHRITLALAQDLPRQ